MNSARVATVLRNGLFVDGSGPAPNGYVDVHVVDGIIRDVGDCGLSAPDALEIDLEGRAIMPGLIDCHIHTNVLEEDLSDLASIPPSLTAIRAAKVLSEMLDRGFTSVRDAGGADWGLKEAVARGHARGPRLFISGHAISQSGGHGDYRARTDTAHPGCNCETALRSIARIADGVDAVRRAVREELRLGADQIKIMASGGLSGFSDRLDAKEFSREELKAAVEEAQNRGTYVMAHAYSVGAVDQALDCGVRTIEHGNLLDARVASRMAADGAYLVPTLVTYWSPDPEIAARYDEILRAGQRAIELCRTAGVRIGFGTDLFGELHREQGREFLLRREVQPAHEVIASATSINASILQMEGKIGIIAPGAIADLIAVDGNPLNDISLIADSKTVSLVMKDGRVEKCTFDNTAC